MDLGRSKVYGESDYHLIGPVAPSTKQTVHDPRHERVPGTYSAAEHAVNFMHMFLIVDTGQWATREWQEEGSGAFVRTRQLGRLHRILA